MYSSALYSLFVTDDVARLRVALVAIAAGATLGSIGSIFGGLDLTGSSIITAVGSVIVLAMLVWRYVRNYAPETATRAGYGSDRRAFLNAGLISFLEAAATAITVFVFLGVDSAVAYARVAISAVKSGQRVSPIKVAIATQAVANALEHTKNEQRLRELRNAYTLLACARVYERAASDARVVVTTDPKSGLPGAFHRIIVQGAGGDRSASFKATYGGPLFSIRNPNLIFENFTFEGPPPPFKGEMIQLLGPSNILVKNCTIRNFVQNLDGIVWVEVTFENCEIHSSLDDTLVVDVDLISCSLNVPTDKGFPVQPSDNTNASHINYSSQAEALARAAS